MANKGTALELCRDHLFSDVAEMKRANIPEQSVAKIMRIRSGYNYWLETPLKKDKEIREFLIRSFGIEKTAAYDDIKVIKELLGEFSRSSKEFHLFRLNAMIEEAWSLARGKKSEAAMAPIIDKYGKYNQLDKEKEEKRDWSGEKMQPFVPTLDPSVLGIKPIENEEELKEKLKKKYMSDISDVEYSELEYTDPEIYNES